MKQIEREKSKPKVNLAVSPKTSRSSMKQSQRRSTKKNQKDLKMRTALKKLTLDSSRANKWLFI